MHIKSLSTRNANGMFADANKTFIKNVNTILDKADNLLADAKKDSRN